MRSQHEWPLRRQALRVLDAQTVDHADQKLVQRKKALGHSRLNRPQGRQPALALFAEDFLGVLQRISGWCAVPGSWGRSATSAQQVADCFDAADRLLVQLDAATLPDFERQVQPFQRINPQVELRIGRPESGGSSRKRFASNSHVCRAAGSSSKDRSSGCISSSDIGPVCA